MENDQSVKSIPNISEFKHRLRTNVYKAYFTIFSSDPDFQDCFDETLLTNEILCFWLEYYTFIDDNGIISIYDLDFEKLEMELYKEFVQAILLKLVDEEKLLMCWDNDRMRVIWKKPNDSTIDDLE